MQRPPRRNEPGRVLRRAVAVQAAAGGLAIAGAVALPGLNLFQLAALQGAIATRLALYAGAPTWWLPLHLAFVPGLLAASTLQVPPAIWGAAALAILLLQGSTWRTRVPLFLSARRVREAIADLLPADAPVRFVDLGCGLGGVLDTVRSRRPLASAEGVELAPLPWLVSRLRGLRAGFAVRRQDLMAVDLSGYDAVCAFLSPAPMPALWAKARREMRPGSLFVSVAFEVPGVAPDRVIRLSDQPRHTLHVWRM